MSSSLSAYLDVLRLTLAVMVLLSHVSLVSGRLPALSACGTQAVDGFFVLSGFVIAYVAAGREQSLMAYVEARATRILSVALPAIALTLVTDEAGRHLAPALYDSAVQPGQIGAIVRSLMFLNEAWSHRFPGSDSPYWSLGFEVPYYAAFGLALFLPRRIGWLLAAFLIACVGPRVACMLPVWLMGAIAFAMTSTLSRRAGLVVAPLGLLGVVVVIALGHERPAFMPLRWSAAGLASVLCHYALGGMLALHVAGLGALTRNLDRPIPSLVRRRIGQAAGCTFSIYLYHVPLMWLTRAALGPQAWLLVMVPMLGSIALAQVTERPKRWPLRALEAFGRWRSRGRRPA